MSGATYIAGFQLIEQKVAHNPNIEYWRATDGTRSAEVYLVPKSYRERLSGIPQLIGLTQMRLVEHEDRVAVLMPGCIETTISMISQQFEPSVCVGVAWHIADLLGLLHQKGHAHNLLHSDSIGINDVGELEIRPALAAFIPSDPDSKATSVATDCWQMAQILDRLGIDGDLDPRFSLLSRGVREELARLRLQPATAIRQSITAVLARHTDWEAQLVSTLGESWKLHQRNIRESAILPHRLYETRPSLPKSFQISREPEEMGEPIDLWGNRFSSSSANDASAAQALLRQAFSSPSKSRSTTAPPMILPISEVPDVPEKLEVELDIRNTIQIPVQASGVQIRSTFQSIQELGPEDDVFEDEEDGSFGFSHLQGIVEETLPEVLTRQQKRKLKDIQSEEKGRSKVLLSKDQMPSLRFQVTEDFDAEEPLRAIEEQNDMLYQVNEDKIFARSENQEMVEDTARDVFEQDELPKVVDESQGSSDSLEVRVSRLEPEKHEETPIPSLKPTEEYTGEEDSFSVEVAIALDDTVDETVPSSENTEVITLDAVVLEDGYEANGAMQETLQASDTVEREELELLVDEREELSSETVGAVEEDVLLEPEEPLVEGFERANESEERVSEVAIEDEIQEKEELRSESHIPVVSILDMPLQPIIEESESFKPSMADNSVVLPAASETVEPLSAVTGEEDWIDDGYDEPLPGISLDFLDEEPEAVVSKASRPIDRAIDSPSVMVPPLETPIPQTKGGGFIAALDPMEAPMQLVELDVEEPLAEIEYPSLEEVHQQEQSMTEDINVLFSEAVGVRDRRIEPRIEPREPVISKHSESNVSKGTHEPKWTGSTAFDNLTDSENALGDEKYALENVELGDVDAVLGQSIRNYSDAEQRGSPWGLLLVLSVVGIFAVLYLLNPTEKSSVTPEATGTSMTGRPVEGLPVEKNVRILTDPPQGRVYIENQQIGVAPVDWTQSPGDVFLMCVDWGSNPICRRIPKSDLKSEYTFRQSVNP